MLRDEMKKGLNDGYENGLNDGYENGLKDGISQGRYQVLATLLEIYNNSKYPEDLEIDIDDYLRTEGIKA